jgi:threonyl-tRNA synthetase
VQAIVLPIADRHLEYASSVHRRLREHGVRAELDERSESISKKVRDAELRRIPYMLVVGDREAEGEVVAVREHRVGDTGTASVADFAARIGELVSARAPRS